MCDVLYCRTKSVITVLGVSLCDEHYSQHCEDRELNTKKGVLTFRSGKTIVTQKKQV